MRKTNNKKQVYHKKIRNPKDKTIKNDEKFQATNREILEGEKIESDSSSENNEENENSSNSIEASSSSNEEDLKNSESFDIKLFMIVNNIITVNRTMANVTLKDVQVLSLADLD
jgi:hypothetical protein